MAMKVVRGKNKAELLRDLQHIDAVGDLDGEDGADVAQRLLNHEDAVVVAAALRTIAGRGEEAGWCASACARQLSAPTAAVRAAAASALGAFGEASAEYAGQLVKLVESDAEDVRAQSLVALACIGAESEAGRMAALVSDASPVISAAACQALGLLEDAGARHGDLIASRLADPQTRHAAVCALGQLGPLSCEPHVAAIASFGLTDLDSTTRMASAAALHAVSPEALEPVIPQVVKLLGSEHIGMRCAAALALGYMGEAGLPYAGEVVGLLEDNAEDVSEVHVQVGACQKVLVTARKPKCAALVALGLMAATNYARNCAKALGDDSYEVRLCALEALSNLGESARSFSSDIAGCLEDPVYYVRAKACNCIAALVAEDAMPSLPELLSDTAPSVKIAALQALGKSPRMAECYPSEVVRLLNDPVPLVKAAAVSVLGNMGETGKCYASVIAGQLNDQDERLRCAACEALGKLGEHGAAFVEEIEWCLGSGSPDLEDAAQWALDTLLNLPAGGGRSMIENFEGEGGHLISGLEGE